MWQVLCLLVRWWEGNVSSVKTSGGTLVCQQPRAFTSKLPNAATLYFYQTPVKHAATTTTRGQKSFHLTILYWLYILANRRKAGQGGGEGGLFKLTLPAAAGWGEGFKQKIIDIIDLAPRIAGGVVWCGVVWGYSRWAGGCRVAVAGAGRAVQLYSHNRFVCWSFPLSHHPQLSLLIDSPRLAFTINPSNQYRITTLGLLTLSADNFSYMFRAGHRYTLSHVLRLFRFELIINLCQGLSIADVEVVRQTGLAIQVLVEGAQVGKLHGQLHRTAAVVHLRGRYPLQVKIWLIETSRHHSVWWKLSFLTCKYKDFQVFV